MAENKIRQRNEIPVEDTWATEDMYATDAAWEEELAGIAEDQAYLASFAGKLGESAEELYTYLTRMEAKGLVRINKEVTPHIYYAMIDRESCQQQERHSFLNRVYSGAAGDLIAAFLKEEPISQEEREKLRKILDDMEV